MRKGSLNLNDRIDVVSDTFIVIDGQVLDDAVSFPFRGCKEMGSDHGVKEPV